MTAKVNVTIQFKNSAKYIVELWDVDVLVDDKIDAKSISKPGPIEFIFSTSRTGEFNPELQLRIFSEEGNELFRSPIDKSISDLNINENTGFVEVTTVDFGIIEL
jgi:hypothetical protein